jgi:putative transposase
VLIGDVRLRVREIIRQVCAEMGVTIINGALSRDHVHMFVEIPPHVSVSDFVRRAKGRSSRKIQQEFEHIRKRYWGQRFWGRGYFSTTAGNITEDVVMAYLDRHIAKEASAPPHDPHMMSFRSMRNRLGIFRFFLLSRYPAEPFSQVPAGHASPVPPHIRSPLGAAAP